VKRSRAAGGDGCGRGKVARRGEDGIPADAGCYGTGASALLIVSRSLAHDLHEDFGCLQGACKPARCHQLLGELSLFRAVATLARPDDQSR